MSARKNIMMSRSTGVGSALHAHWQGEAASTLEGQDQAVLDCFEREHPWGLEALIDLFACDPARIRDPQSINAFAVTLCDFIEMHRFGDPLIVHFGKEERVSGYSLVQLIETSDITCHFIEQGNAACLSIFSCASYPPFAAAAFCQQWFGARAVRISVLLRGPEATRGADPWVPNC